MANNPSIQIDPNAQLLVHAIGLQEGGGTINYNAKGASGESGAYQWMPSTWKAQAKQVLGNADAPMTPENQNQVIYTIAKQKLDQGYTPAQFASEWNSGKKDAYKNNAGVNSSGVSFDTGAYVSGVQRYAADLWQKTLAGPDSTGGIPTANAEATGTVPLGNQGPSVSGFVGNAAKSAGNVIGGLAEAAMHPIQTVQNIAGMAAGGVEKLAGASNEDTQKFDSLVGYLKNRYGGDSLSEVMGHIGNTAYTDPVGMALDLSTVVDGIGGAVSAAGKVSKVAELSKAADLIKQASQLINPIAAGAKVAGKAVAVASDVAKFGASKLIGLNKAEDVSSIINNYDKLSPEARAGMSRESLAQDFGNAMDNVETQMSEEGRRHGGVISANAGKTVIAPENWLADVLEHGTTAPLEDGSKAIPFKVKLEPIYPVEDHGVIQMEPPKPTGYKVVADTFSKVSDSKDIAAIQSFVDKWQPKLESGMNSEEFSNMRKDAAKMAKFGRELGTNKDAALVGRAIRADANRAMRGQITGLAEADASSAPVIQLIQRIRKEFLTPSPTGAGYEFKAGAVNKIANAAGKGKGNLLRLMERVSPGITERIQLMKTVESIESAYNMKVGTYAKDMIGVGSLMHGNIPGVIAAIASHPSIAIPLLQGLGWTKAQIAPVLQFLKTYVNSSTLKIPAEAGMMANGPSAAGPSSQP